MFCVGCVQQICQGNIFKHFNTTHETMINVLIINVSLYYNLFVWILNKSIQ